MPDKPTTPTVPHVRIQKTLYDDVLRGRWTANQLKVVLAVVRWTIGHKAQADGARISRRYIAKCTQVHERSVRAIVDELTAQGVLIEVRPAAARQGAVIALQTDASRWGIHSPAAPPLRRGANAGNLEPYQFGEGLCGHGHPQSAESLCACRTAPPAGVDARTDCGCGRADSEELEVLLLNEQDSDSPSDEASLSALNTDAPGLSVDEGRDLVADYLATHTGKRTFAPDDES